MSNYNAVYTGIGSILELIKDQNQAVDYACEAIEHYADSGTLNHLERAINVLDATANNRIADLFAPIATRMTAKHRITRGKSNVLKTKAIHKSKRLGKLDAINEFRKAVDDMVDGAKRSDSQKFTSNVKRGATSIKRVADTITLEWMLNNKAELQEMFTQADALKRKIDSLIQSDMKVIETDNG